jgi:hypothetical protein
MCKKGFGELKNHASHTQKLAEINTTNWLAKPTNWLASRFGGRGRVMPPKSTPTPKQASLRWRKPIWQAKK